MSPKITFPKYTLLLSTLVAAGVFAACAGGKTINVGSDDASTSGVPTGTPSVSLKNDIFPIFTSGCTAAQGACHGGTGTPTGVVNLSGSASAAYTSMMAATGVVVVSSNATLAATSMLLCKPYQAASCPSGSPGGAIHNGGTQFTSNTTTPYTTILSWIEEGAPNN